MMKKRLLSGLVAAATLSLVVAGCAPSSGGDGGDSNEKPYIALVSKGFQHQFWQAVKAGAEQAAAEFDVEVTFEGAATEGSVEQQIQLLQTVIDKHPDAIGFAAIDSQAAGPLMQQASDDGIPVIAFDSGVDSDVPLTTATTDNLAAAAEAAEHMAELINHTGKVALTFALSKPGRYHLQVVRLGTRLVARTASRSWSLNVTR